MPTPSLSALMLSLAFAGLASLGLGPEISHADTGKPWTCNLEFDARGTDIQILVGYSKISGQGKITCVSNDGSSPSLSQNVSVVLGTPVVFPRIAFGPSIHVIGRATVAMPEGDPRHLLGRYLTVDARVGRTVLMLQVLKENSSTAFDLDLEGVSGFGIAVGGTTLEIN